MAIRNFMLILALAMLWGPSFIFIKIAVEEIPPFTLVFGRVAIASLILYAILRAQGRNLPRFGSVWKHFAFLAFVHNALPFVLFSWGEMHIASALASILNGTTPLFTIVLAHFLIADDQFTPTKLFGVLVGFSGLVLLVAPELIESGLHATTLGLFAIVLASACYGIAIVYSRLYMRGMPPLVAPTAQLGLAGVYMLPLVLWVDKSYAMPMPSWQAIGSILFLAIFGTAIAFVIYYAAVERISASSLSMVTYIIPIIGTFLGVVVLNEQLTWFVYAGCALIILGVMIVNGVFKIRRSQFATASQ
ncbi:DMT family transporter [Anaerolineales bacterium HSG25]|nr:DMT family transporter [Anaerolineales bacterium HSG25]